MKRPILAVLVAALFVSGCVTQQPLLQPGEDPNALAEAIARRGQDSASAQPQPAQPTTVGDCVRTAKKVGATTAVIALALACCSAHGSPSGSHIDGTLHSIWAED
jgi:hypothetical protein